MILLNGEVVHIDSFPNGESNLDGEGLASSINPHRKNQISFKYHTDSDLFKLMIVKNYLDTFKVAGDVELVVYYMPYSRMDRSENGSPFTLKYVANFINMLNFSKVLIVEPHSDVTTALVDRSEAVYINKELINLVKKAVGFDDEHDYIVFPDAGAQKRYTGKINAKNQLVGFKHRDFKTGKIESLEIVGTVHSQHLGKAIIVDDLSSYGGTFVATAESLRDYGIEEVFLLVGHAENSIFKGKLFDHVDHVFTTDTILTEHGSDWTLPKDVKSKLTVYPIEGRV